MSPKPLIRIFPDFPGFAIGSQEGLCGNDFKSSRLTNNKAERTAGWIGESMVLSILYPSIFANDGLYRRSRGAL